MTEIIEIITGTYYSLQFDIGTQEDVSGYTITFSMNAGIGTETPLIQKTSGSGIDMTEASTGTIYVELTVSDTRTLLAGIYDYDLRFEVDSKPEVWHIGSIIVKRPVYIPAV